MQQPVMREPMQQNRRRHMRKVPEKFAFIQIERDEVGKVLNVSEGGLSFSSFSPVPENGPLYFWMSFNLKDRIEAMAEVAWTDSSRRIGGLRFVHQSPISREQLRMWLAQLPAEQSFPEEAFHQAIPKNGHGGGVTNEPDRVARFVAKAHSGPDAVPMGAGEPARMSGFTAPRPRAPEPASEPPPAPFQTATASRETESSGQTPTASSFAPPASRGIERVEEHVGVPSFATLDSRRIEPAEPMRASSAAVASLWGDESPAEKPKTNLITLDLREREPAHPTRASSSAAGASPGIEAAELPRATGFTAATLRGIESAMELVSLQRHLSVKKRQLVLGVLLGILLSATVAATALKYRSHTAHAQNTGPAATESVLAKKDIPAQTASLQPETTPVPPVAGIHIPVTGNAGKTPELTAGKHGANIYGQSSPFDGGPLPAPARKSTQNSVLPQLSGRNTGKKQQMTPKQLWTEVQAGSTTAAVNLAELYIKGEGVARNCQQARVLLLMASEKRNTAAIRKLHELDQNAAACP